MLRSGLRCHPQRHDPTDMFTLWSPLSALSPAAPRRHYPAVRRHHPPIASSREESGEDHQQPGQLILLRHGQSIWNALGSSRFTGWANVDLSERGVREAEDAAELLLSTRIDVCYTSVLRRAIHTAEICVDRWHEGQELPRPEIHRRWRLNERHYGALTGLNKREALKTVDADELRRWRSSFGGAPPPMEPSHPHYSQTAPRYQRLLDGTDATDEPLALEQVPLTESLADTRGRVRPLWERELRPAILGGANVLVVGHANGLRALISCIQPSLSDSNLPSLGVPNALPLVYEFDALGCPVVFDAERAGAAPDDRIRCYVRPLDAHFLGDECVIFSELDADGSGALDEHELQNSDYCRVLQQLEVSDSGEFSGGDSGDECGSRVLSEADGNNDGVVDFNEYMAWWAQLPEPRPSASSGDAGSDGPAEPSDVVLGPEPERFR